MLDSLVADLVPVTNYFAGKNGALTTLPQDILLFSNPLQQNSNNPDESLHHRFVLAIGIVADAGLLVDGHYLHLPEGHATLIAPQQTHVFMRASQQFTHDRWCYMTCTIPQPDAIRSLLGPQVLQIDDACREALAQLIKSYHHTPINSSSLNIQAGLLFHHLLQAQALETQHTQPTGMGLAFHVNTIVTAHLNVAYDCAAIAHHLDLSESHLRRCFRAETGMSLGFFLRETRLQHAAQLLRSRPDLNIQDIAEACGIPNSASFCRAFKRQFGTSPGHYRKT